MPKTDIFEDDDAYQGYDLTKLPELELDKEIKLPDLTIPETPSNQNLGLETPELDEGIIL